MHGSTFKIRTFGDSLFTVADYSNYVARSLNLYAFVDFLPKYLPLSWLSKPFFSFFLCAEYPAKFHMCIQNPSQPYMKHTKHWNLKHCQALNSSS